MEINRLSDVLGAEVLGVDVANVDNDTVAVLRQASVSYTHLTLPTKA